MIDDSYDSDFPYPHLDDPRVGDVRWVDPDRAFIEIQPEKPVHWSEREKLGYVPSEREEWPLGDKMADGSDYQGYDLEEEE